MLHDTAIYKWSVERKRKHDQTRAAVRQSVYSMGRFKKYLANVKHEAAPVLSTEYASDGGHEAREVQAYWGAL